MDGILTWDDLNKFEVEDLDRVNGINNSYAHLRLFGHSENDVLVTLYRDRHSWCPYCQKIWLWLEFKKIPYRVKKINMFCYCLLYTSPSPRDEKVSRMPSSA